MPNSLVKKYAEKSGKTIPEVENIWKDIVNGIKDSGKSKDDPRFYGLVVSILKKKLNINESLSWKEFNLIKDLNVTDSNSES